MEKKPKDIDRKSTGVGSLLDEAEGNGPRKARKPASDDLDLDAAWSKG